MENKTETQGRKKPNRLATPRLVRLLTNVGLTNLSEDSVREYRTLYESHYGSLSSIALSFLHKVGLTNLTNEQVDTYCEMKKRK